MKLNIKRLYLTGRKDFFSSRKQFILIPATILAFGLLIGIVAGKESQLPGSFYLGFYGGILYCAGLILTSYSFKDRHNKDNIHNWLMLPSSTLEKFLIRFAFSTAGIIAVTLAVCMVSSILNGFITLLYGHSLSSVKLFNPFQSAVWQIIQVYLIFHSLFFLGASWFRKNHFLKTVLTLFVIQILISVISGGLGYIFLYRFLEGDFSSMSGEIFISSWITDGRKLAIALRILLQGIIPVTCWTAAYFRLKEAEVKDGV